MKVIDLFNKGANGEEMPEKVKYNGEIYYLNDGNYSTYNKYGYLKIFFQWEWSLFEHLNEEVEIIEDKPFNERVEEIYNRHIDYIYDKEDKKVEKIKFGGASVVDRLEMIKYKLNEIIDKINSMEDK